ncbi:MAG: L,D-transpeptidase family protein [Pseudomonadota bacterium]
MRLLFVSVSAFALSACGLNGTDRADDETAASSAADDNLADPMRSRDPATGEAFADVYPDPEQRPIMQLQVVLDRFGFAPGVVDGSMGFSTTNAIKGLQESLSLPVTGELDQQTRQALTRWDNIPATRVVTIPAEWSRLTYPKIPEGAEGQAEMERLGYESLDEKLAERFHTTVDVLRQLNPGGKPAGAPGAAPVTPAPTPSASASGAEAAPLFTPGQQIRVPNIGGDAIAAGGIEAEGWRETLASLGVGTTRIDASRITVDESDKMLRVFDQGGKLVATFTVSSGSSHDPLPIGEWGITGVARNPPFSYQPDLFWDVPDHAEDLQLPPGPNGPVGVVWIDLTKEHYGIHGTPEPQTIGRAQSHGCVRLTNWDAARLAGMVSTGTKVTFQK